MTSVTVLAGERTIGGTMIAVEDRGATLVFDCGMAYSPSTYPFAHVEPKPGRLLADLIALGMVPYVEGLWNPEFVRGVSVEPAYKVRGLAATERRAADPYAGIVVADHPAPETAVSISHSHLDHTFFVNYVAPAIPVYSSPATGRLVHALKRQGEISGPSRDLSIVEPGGSFQVGGIRAHLLLIDHDLPGATGLLIETPEGAIAYSGDFRLHGRHRELSESFAETAKAAGTRLLILEGTGVRPPEEPAEGEIWVERSELDVVPDIIGAIAAIPGRLALVLLTAENAERVEELAGAVAEKGRLLVLDPGMLAISQAALGRDFNTPYGVFAGPDTCNSSAPGEVLGAVGIARVVSKTEIADSPGDFVLSIPFRRFEELIEVLLGRTGGVIVSSNGIPLGPFDPAWKHLEWWANAFGFGLLRIGSTGHAYLADLTRFAELTGAPTVMGIHSHYPELMPISPEKLLLPVRGRRYELSELPAR